MPRQVLYSEAVVVGSRISDILKAFTSALFETHWNLANSRSVNPKSNIAT